MKSLRRVSTITLIMLIALSLPGCAAPRAQPSAQPSGASATLTTVAPEIKPSPTAVPTIAPNEAVGKEEYREVFEAVWDTVDQTYFDPDFGGLDWDAIRDEYEPRIITAENDQALYKLLNQMIWELNVSHAGVWAADQWPSIQPVVFKNGEIGIDVRLLDDQAVITRVEAGSPAEEAGLRPGFIIQQINGISVGQIIAHAEEHLSPPYNDRGRKDILTRSLAGLIYGDPGTCVTLDYLDKEDGVHEACVERIQRPRAISMAVDLLPPSCLEFESQRLPSGIAYIRFNTFHPDLLRDMGEAVAALQDAPGIIIDLRGNPGGDPSVAEQMAAQFLRGQVLFGSFRNRSGVVAHSVTGKEVYAGQLVILIDASSYSASEWFASGMQATGRAVIIGERSPGGATGMRVAILPNGGCLGCPVDQLLAPDGRVLEGYGVVPDIQVALNRASLLSGVDSQLQAAIEFIQDVNARTERVENGLIEVTTQGAPLWDFPRMLVERMELYGVPGVSLAVINDYRVEWAKGYGVLQASSEPAVTPDTLFHAGSIAKTLSAAAALTLVQQGQLDLDQNVNEKLVSWQVPESEYTQTEKVTLRRLLSHSAGLTDGFTETGIECCYSVDGEAPTVSIEQMLEAAPVTGLPRPARVTQTPGREYRYANLGYGIVQLLVDDTTDVPFAQFMQETVLDPLGMASSTFEQPLPAAVRARASTEHDAEGQPFEGKRHHFPILASGGLWTTPSDLARFAIELMCAYLGQSERLLSQEMARQMLTAQVPIRNGGLATACGLGFELGGAGEIATASRQQLGEALSIQHAGATWGSTCFLIAYPETGQGAVVMTNSRTGRSLLSEILISIAVEYGWPLVQETAP